MPSQYPFRQTICNNYLGVSKVVRATTLNELHWLVQAQQAKWSDQEARKRLQREKESARDRARNQAENLKAQADEDTKTAQQNVFGLRNILLSSLDLNLAINWESLLDRRTIAPFQSHRPKPNADRFGDMR